MTTKVRYKWFQRLTLQPKVQVQNSLFHLGIGLWRLDMKEAMITDSVTTEGRLKGPIIAIWKHSVVHIAAAIAGGNEEETPVTIQILYKNPEILGTAIQCHTLLIIAQSIEELDSWPAAAPTMLAILRPTCVLYTIKIAPVAKRNPMMMKINPAHRKVYPSLEYPFQFLPIMETRTLINSVISSPWKI